MFLVKYGFTIEGETEKALRRNVHKIHNAPWEAISALFLDVILNEPSTAKFALLEMDKLGIIAEVAKMVEANKAFKARLAGWSSDTGAAAPAISTKRVMTCRFTRDDLIDSRALSEEREPLIDS